MAVLLASTERAVLSSGLLAEQDQRPTRERNHFSRHVPSAFLSGFHTLPDPHFRMHFRMARSSFQRLVNLVGPHLLSQLPGRKPLPVHERLAIALWRLGTNDSYRSVATLFNISKASAWEFTHSVSSAIVEAMVRSYVHFPTGDRKARIIAKFRQLCGLDNVVGALDGCHIPIMSPKHNIVLPLCGPRVTRKICAHCVKSQTNHFSNSETAMPDQRTRAI